MELANAFKQLLLLTKRLLRESSNGDNDARFKAICEKWKRNNCRRGDNDNAAAALELVRTRFNQSSRGFDREQCPAVNSSINHGFMAANYLKYPPASCSLYDSVMRNSTDDNYVTRRTLGRRERRQLEEDNHNVQHGERCSSEATTTSETTTEESHKRKPFALKFSIKKWLAGDPDGCPNSNLTPAEVEESYLRREESYVQGKQHDSSNGSQCDCEQTAKESPQQQITGSGGDVSARVTGSESRDVISVANVAQSAGKAMNLDNKAPADSENSSEVSKTESSESALDNTNGATNHKDKSRELRNANQLTKDLCDSGVESKSEEIEPLIDSDNSKKDATDEKGKEDAPNRDVKKKYIISGVKVRCYALAKLLLHVFRHLQSKRTLRKKNKAWYDLSDDEETLSPEKYVRKSDDEAAHD